ncbi:Maf-like protein [Rhizobium sp. LjRoot30]|uniref:Maf-like protein n=1 Tax=Rhizobium sp. LjRoot30 TaxID=3342320 RepID=UPI003ECC5EE2
MSLPLILASSSPFRRGLMQNAGLRFEAIAADIDERAIEAPLEQQGATPDQVALVLAEAKALDVSRRFPDAVILGSDQTMSLGARVYHKPKGRQEASENLLSLAGKTHQLNSAIVLARGGEILVREVAHARLTMRPFTPEFVETYLDRVGETIFKSVGGYQLEGEGIQLFSAIDGDYFTIVGLPMLPLLEHLRNLGVIDA